METIKFGGYIIADDEVRHEDTVIVINDYYNSRDICEYMTPIPETPPIKYTVVKEIPRSDKEYFDVDYALWVTK